VSVPDETSLAALVPAAHAPHAATVLRSLGRRGVHTIAAYERPTPAFSSRYCGETHIVPPPDTDVEGYKDALLDLAARDDVHAVFPLREVDAYVLARHRSEFEGEVRPLWPSFETLETVYDRLDLLATARDAAVATPETRLLDESGGPELSRVVKARYPLITGEYVESDLLTGVREARTVQYLAPGEQPDREALRSEMGHVPIVQEHVLGEEYAFWALYRDGDPVATCQKHQVRAESYAGGTSVYRETVRIPDLEAAGRALLDRLDWHGFASVQFKRDARTGEFTLLEVNPRVWVSVACPVKAGVDFPYYYWQLANGGSAPSRTDYETGVGTHRIAGELMNLTSVVADTDTTVVDPPPVTTAVRDVLESVYRQPHFDYLAADDPWPFLSDLAGGLERQVDDAVGSLRERLAR